MIKYHSNYELIIGYEINFISNHIIDTFHFISENL